jgi:hypothetical protein
MVWASSSVAVTARWLARFRFADVQGVLAAWPPHPAASTVNDQASADAATQPRRCTDQVMELDGRGVRRRL